MGFFWSGEDAIYKLIGKYFNRTDALFDKYLEIWDILLGEGRGTRYEDACHELHRVESDADDIRRDIEMQLYGKSLLPESRGDLLAILEAFDRLPNTAEATVFMILTHRLDVPSELRNRYRELVDINIQGYKLIRKAVDALLSNPTTVLYICKEVDIKESESDHHERHLITDIFSRDDIELAYKILLRDLVLMVGDISDHAENTADRVGIVAIKRRI